MFLGPSGNLTVNTPASSQKVQMGNLSDSAKALTARGTIHRVEDLLWMVAKLRNPNHQLLGGTHPIIHIYLYYLEGFNDPRWCRISSIHRMSKATDSGICHNK